MDTSGKPETMEAFHERLREIGGRMPKRLRQCAEYIAANPDRVAVSTVAELAAAANVQPSAFMRFCKMLGFSGFSDMQRLFRDNYTRQWPDYATRLRTLRQAGADSPGALLAEFADAGRASLEKLTHTIDEDSLKRAVQHLCRARNIHIAGYRRVFPAAAYLAYAFEKMNLPCILHSGIGNLNAGYMMSEQDALIAISYAPYSSETVELARIAHDRQAAVIAITDNITSPLIRLKSVSLLVSEIDVGAFRTLSATLSLAMSLAVSVGARRKQNGHDESGK